MRKVWAMVLTYYYPDESYKDTLSTYVKPYKTEAEAVDALNGIIRDDWTTEVPANDDSGDYDLLADCPGYVEDHGTPKYSSCYYSEDRHLAWAYYTEGHGYRGEVKELEVPE